MCSAAAAGIGLAIAAAATGTMGTYMAATNRKRVAIANADLAKHAQRDALARGRFAEGVHRQKLSTLIGRQRASVGASGAAVDEGSALDVVEDTAAMGELDALMIRNNARREAWGYQGMEMGFLFEAEAASEQRIWGTAAAGAGGASKAFAMKGK